MLRIINVIGGTIEALRRVPPHFWVVRHPMERASPLFVRRYVGLHLTC